ncbi:hypothetical protein VAE151_560315 [Vibrio aestuarianus]|uniref:Uncharacterized protein n=1 Tax=Vibrio aestuarianus TaxID=28171 RepID=A0ABM9FRN0_9VIBR|nr:hypothetical protein VAE308_1050958 [Vibrio aestuarianus]CAH8203836.1 hypothetical protein VAE055_380312 [Vibrio aestuarianus]CAH8203903.1 hypothetical protein VAE032_270954 [Vibrio aestuarianus]CAH8203995.1 hypothetical protein VAE128_460960 [Vibrio aestuarianus]CAH8204152.1 hypothetical protein VAE130_570956 [Vibrio aestuarianus]
MKLWILKILLSKMGNVLLDIFKVLALTLESAYQIQIFQRTL